MKCGESKYVSEFYRDFRKLGGYGRWCKACFRLRQQAWSGRDRDRIAAKNRFQNYGITVEQYERRLVEQNGVCAICLCPEVAERLGTISSLSVDHDHVTGQIRGLLCRSCNAGIGHFKDDFDRMLRAIVYLRSAALAAESEEADTA